jgi:hypothetical protein
LNRISEAQALPHAEPFRKGCCKNITGVSSAFGIGAIGGPLTQYNAQKSNNLQPPRSSAGQTNKPINFVARVARTFWQKTL